MDNKYYLYKPNTESIIKSIGSEEEGWRFYFVLAKVTPTPTNTPSASIGVTPTQTPSQTPTISLTRTQTPTPTQTATVTPTKTPNSTPGITPSNSSTPAVTPTSTPTQSNPAPTATPSSTPNLACSYQRTLNGPWVCDDAAASACYNHNYLNDIIIYTEDQYVSQVGSAIFTDSSCSTLLSPDGFYAVKIGEPAIIYVENGYILYSFGPCSGLAIRTCYVCDGYGNCTQKTNTHTLGHVLVETANCYDTYDICGTYIQYYCECNEPINPQDSPCCSSQSLGYYGNFSSCQENCSP